MPNAMEKREEFLLKVRARVYQRLASCPVVDEGNPNYGFDFANAYAELLRSEPGLHNHSPPRKDMCEDGGANIDAPVPQDMDCRPSPVMSRKTPPAKRVIIDDDVLDLTLSPPCPEPKSSPKRARLAKDSTVRGRRGRQATSNAAEVPATARPAKTRNKPSIQLLTRLSRALAHPLYLVERRKDERNFVIMGATGGLYNVEISLLPKCSCPDFVKRASGQSNAPPGPCKHILFVMHRVLKVDQFDPVLYQVSLTCDELERVFREAPVAPCATVLADDAVRFKFRESEELDTGPKHLEGDCSICMESLSDETRSISVCSTCENGIHAACMQMYLRAGVGGPKCPLCRSQWKSKEEVDCPLNLAQYSSKHSKLLTNAQLYPETHQFIGRKPRRNQRKS
jgi:hypothetical protein